MQVEVCPLEIALETMKETNEKIRSQIRLFENAGSEKQVPVNPLGLVLTGTIDAAVNGGVKNYKVKL